MITKINGTISFEGSAKFTKNGRTDECDMLTFKYWAKNGKERIYINDYKRRTIGYIDVTTGEVVINNNQGNYDSEIEMAIEGFIAEYVTVETDETYETETDKAQGEEQMTREQKIKNILEETRAAIEEEVKNGTMAPDKKIKYRAERLISAEREVINMRARTVILFVIAKLMAFAITASAAVMSYLPLAYLAYEERGYFAIGGEILGALIITAVVGWAANIVMKDWFRGMLKLFGKEKKI